MYAHPTLIPVPAVLILGPLSVAHIGRVCGCDWWLLAVGSMLNYSAC